MKIWFIWDIGRFLMHVPAGILTYCMVMTPYYMLDRSLAGAVIGAALGFINTGAFIYYEKNEDRHITDCAFKDTQGFLGGGYLAYIVHLIIVLVK